MPTILSSKLTLDRQPDGNVKLKFVYRAFFSPLERHAVTAGARYVERVDLLGMDSPGFQLWDVLSINNLLLISDGDLPIIVERPFEKMYTRAALDEDPTAPFVSPDWNADEFRCRVQIAVIGFSNEQVLGFLPPTTLQEIQAAEVKTDAVSLPM